MSYECGMKATALPPTYSSVLITGKSDESGVQEMTAWLQSQVFPCFSSWCVKCNQIEVISHNQAEFACPTSYIVHQYRQCKNVYDMLV